MEAQIALLRLMRSGEEPVSLENIKKAYNPEVLAENAVATQQASVEATLAYLNKESDRLESAIARRRHQLQRLDGAEASLRCTPLSPMDLEKLRHVVLRLSEGYLSTLGLGDSERIAQVIWRLLEVTERNEHLIVPADHTIVQYLVEEGLVRSEPAGSKLLRVKLQ